MSNQFLNPQPNYSGVTIQIANPAVNVSPYGVQSSNCSTTQENTCNTPVCGVNTMQQSGSNGYPGQVTTNPIQQQNIPYAYPPQYYLNNYNTTNVNGKNVPNQTDNIPDAIMNKNLAENIDNEADMTRSNEIIEGLNNRGAELKEQQKNTKETKIVALTDDYIKSLEKYLDNPNDEVRLMASKEVLKRLDEDKDRYDDAALNALLNKMMQDPSKLVRIAALSAFSSGLACGNDYTVKLLKDIQSNPKSDQEDILEASNTLLKMSAGVEVKKVPIPEMVSNEENNK